MVKSGQVSEFGFSNPDRRHLGVEVVDFGRMTRRLPARTLSSVHRTDFHQVFLITGGSGEMMVDFVDHPCVAGTLLHVAPGRVLRLPPPGLEATVVLFTATFPPRLDRAGSLLASFGPVGWTVPPDERRTVVAAAAELHAEYRRAVQRPRAITVDLLRHLLGALLLRVARLAPEDEEQRHDAFHRFRHELERSFATTRNAADYAARVGYSPRTLNRVCLQATGRTAKALVDARVALEAKRLLADTDLSVAAVGARLGFTEPTNFGKFFTRETGATPGAFRARERT
ncbi:helix-turn-helix domain-containing protein [Umezawaea tangerina]|uniref:AraC-like DNA-binding protein n=1 Tax=Umezawaea tangerina TaxID=84725 RepID=A0A2T0TA87_9PSEU|nr:helix-turn-helix transcriptional regulator [Umezawaea tangerina]PRY42571.1 AraC-like DNA-binding protein [Umezawaea tangerina]